MAAAERRVAFRGLVKVAKKLARRYAEAPRPATLSQSSTDAALKTFVRKLLLVVHPDKGGLQADFVELRDAQTRWVELGGGGGPGGGGEGAPPDGLAKWRNLGIDGRPTSVPVSIPTDRFG